MLCHSFRMKPSRAVAAIFTNADDRPSSLSQIMHKRLRIDSVRIGPGHDTCYHRTNATHRSLGHARLFSLGFGNVSGVLRIARFSCPALSGSPRRFRSCGESLPMVHPRDVSMTISSSVITTLDRQVVPSDLNKPFTLSRGFQPVTM